MKPKYRHFLQFELIAFLSFNGMAWHLEVQFYNHHWGAYFYNDRIIHVYCISLWCFSSVFILSHSWTTHPCFWTNNWRCIDKFCDPRHIGTVELTDMMICAPWDTEVFSCLAGGRWEENVKTRQSILSSNCMTKYNLCTLNALWRQLEQAWRLSEEITNSTPRQIDGQSDFLSSCRS